MPRVILATYFYFVSFVARPVEYSHGRGVSVVLVTLFHGASPVEYRLDQDRVVCPKRYSTGESYLLSDLLFYLWTVFVYHETHEDHEEFDIPRPLRYGSDRDLWRKTFKTSSNDSRPSF
ncbi:MAG: hypothetical protein V3W37_05670, partial [Candidatus Binatia bacterium]